MDIGVFFEHLSRKEMLIVPAIIFLIAIVFVLKSISVKKSLGYVTVEEKDTNDETPNELPIDGSLENKIISGEPSNNDTLQVTKELNDSGVDSINPGYDQAACTQELSEKEIATQPNNSNIFKEDFTNQLSDADLAGLVKDRIDYINDLQSDLDSWAMEIADFIDEINLLQNSCSKSDCEVLRTIVADLDKSLNLKTCELINLDEWDPGKQRAVSVNKVLASGEAPKIIKKGAAGLMVKGKLVRKQEVHLEINL